LIRTEELSLEDLPLSIDGSFWENDFQISQRRSIGRSRELESNTFVTFDI